MNTIASWFVVSIHRTILVTKKYTMISLLTMFFETWCVIKEALLKNKSIRNYNYTLNGKFTASGWWAATDESVCADVCYIDEIEVPWKDRPIQITSITASILFKFKFRKSVQTSTSHPSSWTGQNETLRDLNYANIIWIF